MFKRFQDTINTGLATAAEQAKARNVFTNGATGSPRNSTSIERSDATPVERPATAAATSSEPVATGPVDAENEDAGDDVDTTMEETVAESSAVNNGASAELPNDVRRKLNRLDKMESKYPALLKAYRGLQAVEAQVKVFEKLLSETTSASSINDTEAFQQWAQSTTMKSSMVMDELRKKGEELAGVQKELQSNREAHEAQITELQSRLDAAPSRQEPETDHTDVLELEHALARAKDEKSDLERRISGLDEAHAVELRAQKKELSEKDASQKRKIKELTDRVHVLEADLVNARREVVELKITHAKELRQVREPAVDAQVIGSEAVTPVAESREEPSEESSAAPLSKSQKKKQRNKKRAQASSGDDTGKPEKSTETIPAAESVQSATARPPPSSSAVDTSAVLRAERDSLQSTVDRMTAEAAEHEQERTRLAERLSKFSDTQESIEDLRDMVRDLGDELVDAKDRHKEAITQRDGAEARIKELQTSLQDAKTAGAQVDRAAVQDLELAREELQNKVNTLQAEVNRLTQDLEIAEKLSAERFKELTQVKDQLRVTSSELSSLKTINAALQAAKDNLENGAKASESQIKALEVKERDRRDEVSSLKGQLSSREKELRVIQTAFKEEEQKRKAEEARATTVRGEMSKMQELRDSMAAARDDLTRQLATVKAELDKSEKQVSQLQQQRSALIQERDAAKEEHELGAAKFDSAKSLMESQREQTQDMAHRLREAEERRESAEEELAETNRQMRERAREAETLRRLLTELEGSLESRVRDMRERMEQAFSDRDKAEDEAAAAGKRRMRELETLQEKVVEGERQYRRIDLEAQDAKRRVADLERQLEQDRREKEDREQRNNELASAVAELSRSMKSAEAQVTSLERERDRLRVSAQEAEQAVERLRSELAGKNDIIETLRQQQQMATPPIDTRARQPSNGPAGSGGVTSPGSPAVGRNDPSTFQSPRIGRSPSMQSIALSVHEHRTPMSPSVQQQQHHGGGGGFGVGGGVAPQNSNELDRAYIRNILMQFVDNKTMRPRLAPVLGKLLLMDKQQEGAFVRSLK